MSAVRRSLRTPLPLTDAHIESMPASRAVDRTFAAPMCRVRSKNGMFSELTAAFHSGQTGVQVVLSELLTGPGGEVLVRPASGNSLVSGGESQYDCSEMPCLSAVSRSYTLNDEPGGCSPKPEAVPSSS